MDKDAARRCGQFLHLCAGFIGIDHRLICLAWIDRDDDGIGVRLAPVKFIVTADYCGDIASVTGR